MDGGQKEIKRILQIAADSLKSLEYLQMVLNERVKVEEHYLQGLNKVQGQLNFVREGDPLVFECSALRVDTSQRASHTAYLIEQMKGEQNDITSILKENGDRLKESENFFRESEKNFRSQMQGLDKQKEKLSQANKEVEEACLYFGLVQDEVPSDVQKWKERRSQVLERLKVSLQNKNELSEQYSRELASSNGAVTDWNTELPGKYEQLVVSLDNLKRDINDIARKQMVFEVNQIRNIQYDLGNVIGQVDSRPSFITGRQQVTLRTSIHKPLNFHSFFSNLTARLIKSAEEILEGNDNIMENISNVEQKEDIEGTTSRMMTPIVEEAVLGKEERQAIQSYFQNAILQQSNELSLLKRKSIRDTCHYLVNSVVKEQGDCADLDVINIDITVFLQELNKRGMNSKLAQQALEAKSNNDNISSNEKNSRNNSNAGGVDGNNHTNTIKEEDSVASQIVVESSKQQDSESGLEGQESQGKDQKNQEKDIISKEQGQQGQSDSNEGSSQQQDSNNSKKENEKEKSQSSSRKSSSNSNKSSPQKEEGEEEKQKEEEKAIDSTISEQKTEEIVAVVADGINSAEVNGEVISAKEQTEKEEDQKEKEVSTIPAEKHDSQVTGAPNEYENSIKETGSAEESRSDPAVAAESKKPFENNDKTDIDSVEMVPKGEDNLDVHNEDAKGIKMDLTEDKQAELSKEKEGQEGLLSDKVEQLDEAQASEDVAGQLVQEKLQQQPASSAAGTEDANANSKPEEEPQESLKEKESVAQAQQETAAIDINNSVKEATAAARVEETQITEKRIENSSEITQPAAPAAVANNDTSQQDTQSIQSQQPVSQPQPQEILEPAPLSVSFSNLENGEIFLLFLESFRQCGRGQLTVSSGNQLISECFRYMDYLESEKNTSLVTQFMPLTLAIHRNTSVEKVYLQDKVKNHQLWAYNDLWETMIYTQTHNELTGLDASVQNELPVYQATVYANLSAIGLNMLKFRATKTYTKNILAKLSSGYNLPANMLGDLTTFVENIGQTEKTLSFVKNLQAKPNISKGRVVIFGGPAQQQQQRQQQQQQSQQVLQQSQSLQSSGIRSQQTGSATNVNVSNQPSAGGTDNRTGVVGASNTRLTMSAFPTTTTQNKDNNTNNTVNALSWQSPQLQPQQQQLFQKPPQPVILQQQQQQSAVKSSSADVASAFSPDSTAQQQQQQQQVFLSTRTASVSSANNTASGSNSTHNSSSNPFTNPISLADTQISQQQQSSPLRHLSTDFTNQGEFAQQQSALESQQLSSILKAAQSEAAAEQLTYGNQQIYKAQTAPGVFVIKQQSYQPITSNPSNNLQYPQQQQQQPQAVQPSVKPNPSNSIGSQQIPLAVQQTASSMNEQSIQANLINAAKRNSSKFSMSLFGAAGQNKPIGNNFAINPNNSNNNNNQGANLNNKKL